MLVRRVSFVKRLHVNIAKYLHKPTPKNSQLVIARLREDNYLDRHPIPTDIILVIEVADSTLTFDKSTKASLYAAAGISEYWIVNLVDNQLEIYRQPQASIYTSSQIIFSDGSVTLPQFSEIALHLADIFPPVRA